MVAGEMVARMGSQGPSLTKADDMGGGEDDMELPGWVGADDYVVVVRHGLTFLAWAWVVVNGVWC